MQFGYKIDVYAYKIDLQNAKLGKIKHRVAMKKEIT